jgi:hypothetical protein
LLFFQRILRGKNSKLVYGTNVRIHAAYKAIIGLCLGIAGIFAVIAAGALAVKKGLDAVEEAAASHPQKVKAFKSAVQVLNRIADRLPDGD